MPGSRLGAFCRGLDVTLTFDPRSGRAGGLFLLASVLDRFLALHATVNSFVRTGVLRGRPDGPRPGRPAPGRRCCCEAGASRRPSERSGPAGAMAAGGLP